MADEDVSHPYTLTTPDGVLHKSREYTGTGKAQWEESNDIYNGEFKDGSRDGRGTYTYSNGDVYKGGWQANKKHGDGMMTYGALAPGAEEPDEEVPRGGKYQGQFADGMRHGEGTFHYINGDKYSGQWQFNKPHGDGHYVYKADKTSFKGQWEKGTCTGGKWIHVDGKYVAMQFRYGKPSGDAAVALRSGQQILGKYDQTLEEAEEAGEDEEQKGPTVTSVVWKTAGNMSVGEAEPGHVLHVA